MRFSTALVCAAGIYRVSAVVGAPFCMAACTPLAVVNPIAYAACMAGCAALNVSEEEAAKSPRFLPDGTVVFEKESSECSEACKPLVSDPLTYSACLGGCAVAGSSGK